MSRLLAAVAVVAGLGGPSAADAASPSVNYVLHCQGCHLADGTGTPGSGVPPLAGSVGRFAGVPEGRAYLVRVPGVAQAPLGDAELAELLTWTLRHFSAAELPADFVPFTADEMSVGRRTPLTDVEGTRRNVLEQLRRTAAERSAAPSARRNTEHAAP